MYTICNIVKWGDSRARKSFWGVGVVDPKETLETLLIKWVLYTLQFGFSNLQFLFRHQINAFKLNNRRKWGSNLNWALHHRKHIVALME
jgi:hypothetical protein